MTFSPRAVRPLRSLMVALLSAGLLAACAAAPPRWTLSYPKRLVVFGDELSHLTDDGHKYSLNLLDANNSLACGSGPLWVQVLAAHYGKSFAQCSGSSSDTTAIRETTTSARVDDLVTQVDSLLAGSGLQGTDLVTVLVGMHDVLDQYALYDGSNQADLESTLKARGEILAAQGEQDHRHRRQGAGQHRARFGADTVCVGREGQCR